MPMFPVKFIAALCALLVLKSDLAIGHPEEFSERPSGAELARREHLASKRHLAARSCAPSINAFHAARRAKRSLAEQVPLSGTGGLKHASVEDIIHSYTCVTAPEIEEGPYYVNNELIRQDLIEDQKGVKLRLDIGVINTATCEPVPDAFVELWSANATGFYGAFETKLGPGPGGDPDRRPPGGGDRPRPPPGGPRGGHGGPPMSSRNTWLRGGYPTDAAGTVDIATIYPGFYSGRTIHVHLMVHMGWEEAANGTIISHSGSVKHVGQLFFDESWNDAVLRTSPYGDNKGRRTLNAQDHDFTRASIDGSSAIVQLEMVKDSVEEGLLGFITIGIDTSANYTIHSNNYNNGTDALSGFVDVE
ncbi:Intradiol ring-cleavage dioxygenase [Phellopilus nigrolimitatus]|nr:Intradiol ring-cleavage dioxygenase [Phellopilus nigrolimitatus]